MQADVIVIGGGTVGAAIAYGLARKKLRVLVLDGDDGDFRAARANFGLVWLQGKGINMPAYQAWTRASIDLWPDFNRELAEPDARPTSSMSAMAACTSASATRTSRTGRLHLQRLHNQLGGRDADWEMLDRDRARASCCRRCRLARTSAARASVGATAMSIRCDCLRRCSAAFSVSAARCAATRKVESICRGQRRLHGRIRRRTRVGAARRDRRRTRLAGACAAGRPRNSASAAARAGARHRAARAAACRCPPAACARPATAR